MKIVGPCCKGCLQTPLYFREQPSSIEQTAKLLIPPQPDRRFENSLIHMFTQRFSHQFQGIDGGFITDQILTRNKKGAKSLYFCCFFFRSCAASNARQQRQKKVTCPYTNIVAPIAVMKWKPYKKSARILYSIARPVLRMP